MSLLWAIIKPVYITKYAQLLFIFALFFSGASSAHKLAPALLQLTETEVENYQVYWKLPSKLSGDGLLQPDFPKHCQASKIEWQRVSTALEGRWKIDCSNGGLAKGTIGVDRLDELRISVLLTIKHLDKEVLQVWLDEKNNSFLEQGVITRSAGQTMLDYIQYGIKHILSGWDHLVFLLLLLVLLPSSLRLLYAVTAFTLGHSVTLVLASVDLLVFSTPMVEVLIALSIVLLAVQIISGEEGWFSRRAGFVTFGFGLLHGLGFASVLQQVGLPDNDLLLALASFNIGIELGQLAFVFLLWNFLRYGRRWVPVMFRRKDWLAYSLGSLAAFWTIERTVLLLS